MGLISVWGARGGEMVAASSPPGVVADLLAGRFQWIVSAPLIGPAPATNHGRSIKDPSIVFYQRRWHLFATLRTDKPANMEYPAFTPGMMSWPEVISGDAANPGAARRQAQERRPGMRRSSYT